MGVYVFEPEILGFIEKNQYLDFPDLVLSLIGAGKKVVSFPFDGYWLDIGRHEDYVRAQEEFETLTAGVDLD
jgi:NDP-sugar pyrophosphorylase family protein